MLYRITVKNSKQTNGIRVEKGMSVDVASNSMSNPVTTNGGQAVVNAFMRIYGIDIKKAGALSMAYLDVEKLDNVAKQEKKEVTTTPNDQHGFFEGLKDYLESHRAKSTFLDSFCSACDKYTKAVNSYPIDDKGRDEKKELLKEALVEAQKSLEIKDQFSQSIIPNGLIASIEQEISKL